MRIKCIFIFSLLLCLGFTKADAMPDTQEIADGGGYTGHTEYLPKGDFEHWTSEIIHESKILGGKTVNLLHPGAPWGSSNVWAKISGVTKTNVSVYRDNHPGHGHCIKLYTHIVEAKVLGIINIKVLAAGSIFLGKTIQPIRDTKKPMAKIEAGIPFRKRPKAIIFDYKTHIVPGDRIYQNGITKGSKVHGQDKADCVLFLQKRWEDAKGNIYAKRVGTMVQEFSRSCDWKNNATFNIHYGDISHTKFYNSASALTKGKTAKYARNSKGKMVPVTEVGWVDADERPTHLVLQFTSSNGAAYEGSVGNTMWVDNVRMAY